MRRTKELPRKIRNLSGYCLSGLALAGITMCKGAFNVKTKLLSWLLTLSLLMTMLPTAAFAADGTSENTYEVSTAEELSTELTNITASTEDEATIVLKADITLFQRRYKRIYFIFWCEGQAYYCEKRRGRNEEALLSFLWCSDR